MTKSKSKKKGKLPSQPATQQNEMRVPLSNIGTLQHDPRPPPRDYLQLTDTPTSV
ncbi:hypothetical protein YC2023_075397 [Brassica napus]